MTAIPQTKLPPIPEPGLDLAAQYQTLLALKHAVDIIALNAASVPNVNLFALQSELRPIAAQLNSSPAVTTLTSGSGTYVVPKNCKWLRVRMAGGGAGGMGGNQGSYNGSAGNNTTFGATLLVANGAPSAVGGAATIGSGASGLAISGSTGRSPTFVVYPTGGIGGSNLLGGGGVGAGPSSATAIAGGAGVANTGGGGGGGNCTTASTTVGGYGGGAGGYIDAIISSPADSYAYVVGTGGNGGAAGTNGGAGGAGAAGIIVVEAYFS